jgi:hypothetical protein
LLNGAIQIMGMEQVLPRAARLTVFKVVIPSVTSTTRVICRLSVGWRFKKMEITTGYRGAIMEK